MPLDVQNTWQDHLAAWQGLTPKHPGPVDFSLRFGQGSPHLLVFACVHGDEVGNLPAILRLAQELAQKEHRFAGTITMALGNVPAIEQGVRYITHDLNRLFGKKGSTPEHKRAAELSRLIEACDYFIDLHQCIGPAVGPFCLSPNFSRCIDFAKATKAAPKVVLWGEGHTTHSAMSYAYQLNKVGFVLESLKKGLSPKSEQISYRCILNAVELLAKGEHCVLETAMSQKVQLFKYERVVKFESKGDHLKKGLVNLAYVKKGELLGKREAGGDIVARDSGFLLFPKYPLRDEDFLGNNLVVLLKEAKA